MVQELASDVSDIQTTPVDPEESSFIRGFTIDPNEEILEVRLHRDEFGEVPYYYTETGSFNTSISESFYHRFKNAESYGTFYNDHIRQGNYAVRTPIDVNEGASEDLRQRLKETTSRFVDIVAENDSSLLLDNHALFESIRRRESDYSVLHIEDSDGGVTELAQHFRNQLIRTALVKIVEKHGSELEWVTECFEEAEKCSSVVQTYRFAHQI